MKSLFEEMGGTYRQVGDYFFPNLVLSDEGNYQIGKYGRMRRSYLKESALLQRTCPISSRTDTQVIMVEQTEKPAALGCICANVSA